jgi:uncharacterized protein YbaP (TraB family)
MKNTTSGEFNRPNSFFIALVLGACISIAGAVSADTSVWEVKSATNTLYLGGTVHLLRSSDYPLPEEYEQAYLASSKLYFEVDLNSMTDMSVQAQLLKELTYSDGRSLKTVLNTKAYTALSDYVATAGLPLALMEQFKPGMIVTTLQLLQFQKMGFTPQGVDAFFNTRAIGDGKSLGQLETVQEQIGFLSSMGEGNESEFILLSLQDLSETTEVMGEMISAWRAGDNDRLSKLFVDEMKAEAPEIYETLLRRRNLNWMPQIEQMLKNDEIEFVLVGAAHLVGGDGLLELLSEKGYQVRQL